MRLLKRGEYLRVQNKNTRLYSTNFLILAQPSQSQTSRLGIIVTKKVDKRAVQRNRIKRLLREVFRLHRRKISSAFDFVIIARKNAADCSFVDVQRQIVGALRRGGLLR